MVKRNDFSKEFKLEALSLLERSEKPAAVVARELGVRRNQLYKWRDELRTKGRDGAFNGRGRNAAIEQLSEVTLLKRRVAQLEEENTILKKAAAYFAKELQ